MVLKELRSSFGITQQQAAMTVGMPLRTYIRYERDEEYGDILKRTKIQDVLIEEYSITEEKGVLTIDTIESEISKLINSDYLNKIQYCCLFGSYAKGYAKANSDIDLCVSTNLTGFEFLGLVEAIRQRLHKNIDLIRVSELKNNLELMEEILKDGVIIYKN